MGFTCNLSSMGGNKSSAPSPDPAELLEDRVTGYKFELRNCVNSEADGHKYQVVAYPVVSNQTGVRAFCSDESGVIRLDAAGSADDCLGSRPAARISTVFGNF